MRHLLIAVIVMATIALSGCNHSSVEAKGTGALTDGARPFSFLAPKQRTVTLAQGTKLQVRLDQTISTQQNRPGDRFEASLLAPVAVDGKVVVPAGTRVEGIVRNAKPSGRLKGRAILSVALSSIEVNGRSIPISTSSQARVSGGHTKRNLGWLGGGTGTGAAIGALAAGGAGAAIGAGAGAAAGLTGALVTGKKQVHIPAETVMTFRLQQPLTISGGSSGTSSGRT